MFKARPEPKLYQDEIYHDKVLSPLAVAIIDTPEFQRLDGLKQLAFSYLAYRGATHTRFSHSIGVYFSSCTLLRRIVQNHARVFDRNPGLGDPHPGVHLSKKLTLLAAGSGYRLEDYKGNQGPWRGMTEVVSAAALLHDIGHVPFGHTLEDEYSGLCEKHDSLASPRLFAMLFDEKHSELASVFSEGRERWLPGLANGELRKLIFVILSFKEQITEGDFKSFSDLIKKGINDSPRSSPARTRLEDLKTWHDEFVSQQLFHPFMSDVIANTICADILDYLVRDQRNLGLEARSHKRILRYFLIRPGSLRTPSEGLRLSLLVCRPDKGGQRRDVATSILEIMRERYTMAERVFYHHKKAAASAMLVKLFEISSEKSRPRDDEEIYPAPWNEQAEDPTIRRNGKLGPHLVHLSDSDMLEHLGHCEIADGAKPLQRRLHLGIRYRKLYRTLLVVDTDLACKEGHLTEDFVQNLWGVPGSDESLRKAHENRIKLERDLGLAAYPGQQARDGDVLIYCPGEKMQSKEIDVRVELTYGSVRPLRREYKAFTLKRDIDVLSEYYRDLWRMYLFVSPELYEDDAKCLRILQVFSERYDLPVEEVLKKARKPQLLKLFKVKETTPAKSAPQRLPFLEEEGVRLAARSGVLVGADGPKQSGEESLVEQSDAEFFAGVVPKLGTGSRSQELLSVFLGFLKKRNFGSIRNHVSFLRFVRDTYLHWQFPSRRVYTDEQLETWFREHQEGKPFGSKL